MAAGVAIDRQQRLARFLEARHRTRTARAPRPDEGGVGASGGAAVLCLDDRVGVRTQLVVQARGRGGEEVAERVDGAPRDRGPRPRALAGRLPPRHLYLRNSTVPGCDVHSLCLVQKAGQVNQS